ncbi:hypothetical protein [Embleya sp. NPDC020630]|uniref:hypothetical protein n=1 Tax=Embleya sp. NPDC020630 TaxID=3363979 RepID=UPI0037AD4F04
MEDENAVARLVHRLRELHALAGSPTYDVLVRQGAAHVPAVMLRPASLRDWFNGRAVPSDAAKFAFLVTFLETRARATGTQVPPSSWERLRQEAVRERRPPGRPRREHPTDGQATDEYHGVGRAIRESTDPFALEVHRAIDPPDDARADLPILPVYVERAHDAALMRAAHRAAAGESTMVCLVGESSTGKTRACWETVQRLPGDWRLWHPLDPTRPEAALAELPRLGPRTVVWLNEAHFYLQPPNVGERVAAALRELLRTPDRGPVLILGTIWPEFWSLLTTTPHPGMPDPHAQARALLTDTDIPVASDFSGTDRENLRRRLDEDPRLAQAWAACEDDRITQYLAGAPAVMERYRNASPVTRAVIEVAMDARRLGHTLALPHGLLAEAAPGYLTDLQWSLQRDDWLEQALAEAGAPCRGARSPLTRIRPRPGEPAPTQPHYRLADHLEQHGRHSRQLLCPPASFWEAATRHPGTPADLLTLAHAALNRSRLATPICSTSGHSTRSPTAIEVTPRKNTADSRTSSS